MRILSIIGTFMCVSAVFSATLETEQTYTYLNDIQPVINSRCLSCHQDWAASYDTITNKPNLVVPGDPDNSNIIWRLEGQNADGNSITRMPYGGPYLDEETIAMFRTWIADGAPEDAITGVEESSPWSDVKRLFE